MLPSAESFGSRAQNRGTNTPKEGRRGKRCKEVLFHCRGSIEGWHGDVVDGVVAFHLLASERCPLDEEREVFTLVYCSLSTTSSPESTPITPMKTGTEP